MEFYRDMFVHFFQVNYCGLDILDKFLECAMKYIMKKLYENCTKTEIIEYCENEKGMNKEEIDLCLLEIKNDF